MCTYQQVQILIITEKIDLNSIFKKLLVTWTSGAYYILFPHNIITGNLVYVFNKIVLLCDVVRHNISDSLFALEESISITSNLIKEKEYQFIKNNIYSHQIQVIFLPLSRLMQNLVVPDRYMSSCKQTMTKWQSVGFCFSPRSPKWKSYDLLCVPV